MLKIVSYWVEAARSPENVVAMKAKGFAFSRRFGTGFPTQAQAEARMRSAEEDGFDIVKMSERHYEVSQSYRKFSSEKFETFHLTSDGRYGYQSLGRGEYTIVEYTGAFEFRHVANAESKSAAREWISDRYAIEKAEREGKQLYDDVLKRIVTLEEARA